MFQRSGMICSSNTESFKAAFWGAWYVYLVPLFASLVYILYDGNLLGDYSYSNVDDYAVLYQAAVLYLAPLALIVVLLALFGRRVSSCVLDSRRMLGVLSVVLLIHGLLVIAFGAIATGGDSSVNDFGGLARLLLSKINPYYCFILICFHAGSKDKVRIILLAMVIVVETVTQRSLQGYWILFIAVFMYLLRLYGQNIFKTIIILVLPVLLAFHLGDTLQYIYEARNESRGSALSDDLKDAIFKLALGRINSLSSVYSIIKDDCCKDQVDPLYSVSNFVQRFTGINTGGQTSPTQVFNDSVLGSGADYAIFTGTLGSIYILFNSGVFTLVANCILLLLEICFIYKLIPWNGTRREKITVFMVVIYMPYLSGDSWELSILLQQVMVLYVLFWAIAMLPRRLRLLSSVRLPHRQPPDLTI